ncbi:hypothetical protein BGZ63DRAFT_222368 [Mariannaea sp. PMI_226]|nr:hypothetical protein BGZ63DRAFT_222368 [Mariannaea sp. PMI_226]
MSTPCIGKAYCSTEGQRQLGIIIVIGLIRALSLSLLVVEKNNNKKHTRTKQPKVSLSNRSVHASLGQPWVQSAGLPHMDHLTSHYPSIQPPQNHCRDPKCVTRERKKTRGKRMVHLNVVCPPHVPLSEVPSRLEVGAALMGVNWRHLQADRGQGVARVHLSNCPKLKM